MHFERLKCQAAIDLDKLLLVTGKEVRAFNARANPVYLLQVSNVHILNAHTVAVDVSSGRVRNIQKPFANSQCIGAVSVMSLRQIRTVLLFSLYQELVRKQQRTRFRRSK